MKSAILILFSSFGLGLISIYLLLRRLKSRVVRRKLWKQIMKGSSTKSSGGFTDFLKRFWYMASIHLLGFKWGLYDIFTKHRTLDWQSIRKRPGDVVVITGGARGIGAEIVKKLLQAEMHVIIGCRKVSAGNLLLNQIRESGVQQGSAEVMSLDLMSLDSVRCFAGEILAKNCPIHILINNAGIMFAPYEQTIDGFESHFQVNYLSHFLLANLLIPRMAASTGPTHPETRIINVSSIANYGGNIDLNDMQLTKFYSPYLAYMNSKLLQVISSTDMDAHLQAQGINKVRVHSVHPGIVRTDLYEHLWWVTATQFIVKFLFKTPEQGADGVVYAALSPEIENDGGLYLANSTKHKPNPKVFDASFQLEIRNATLQLIGDCNFNQMESSKSGKYFQADMS